MIRIRFHGRGGHGIKTAGRIVGTAAFLAGYQVQDSPVYGAERRGAAVVAFTRISESPILERGLIDSPDLIVIADESLLNDRGAAVLAGQESASAVFVNASSSDGIARKYNIETRLVTCDLSTLTRETLGKASALSAGLGAAAARLSGLVSSDQLAEAVREELSQLHAAQGMIEKNQQVAARVFAELTATRIQAKPAVIVGTVEPVGYDHPRIGTSSIVTPGNAVLRNTGTWRVERPEIDRDVCSRCQLCVLECPDGAMSLDHDGYPVIDYEHCKGCMICAHLCPLHAIGRAKEVRAW